MSEIKGQLLGIVLVLAIFGIVLGIMTLAFQNSGQTIASRLTSAASGGEIAPGAAAPAPEGRVHSDFTLNY